MKINVAGFSIGLPIQNAKLAPTDAFFLRKPTATGAAQHVHIIPGSADRPPIAVLPNEVLPSTFSSQLAGSKTCINDPKMIPNTAAFQTALKYVKAYDVALSHEKEPVADGSPKMESPIEWVVAAKKLFP